MRVLAVLVAGLLALLSALMPTQAVAAEPMTWEDEIAGVPVWITVVPRGAAASPAVDAESQWWQWGDTVDDIYLFSFARPDETRLILEFVARSDGRSEARVYYDESEGSPLLYAIQEGQLQIRPPHEYPYLTLRTMQGNWISEGAINYDLELLIDGANSYPGFGPENAPTDGVIDIAGRVGSIEPGVIDWSTARLLRDPDPAAEYIRFTAEQRMQDAPPYRVANGLMQSFPYFGIDTGKPRWARENPFPLYFDISSMRFYINFAPGFQNGGTYYVSSPSLPPYLSFESPFGFYSFDQNTRQPHLVVRAEYFPPGSRRTLLAPDKSSTSFRYSWKTGNEGLYAYSLQVAGTEPYTREVTIGDETFLGIPAEDLPRTVTTTPWPAVTFVEAEAGFQGEGIYFYSVQSIDQVWPWLIGRSQQPPSYFANPDLQFDTVLRSNGPKALPLNMRGEYHSAYVRAPMLYLSPLDGRLHLYAAEGGIWNLGDGTIVRTSAREGGPYIDTWRRERLLTETSNDAQMDYQFAQLVSQLHAFDGHVLYSDTSQVRLWATNAPLAEFEIAPPHDQASWKSFVARVEPYRQQAPDATAMANWADRLAESHTAIEGARVEIVNQDSDPFVFTLTLEPGFRVSGQDSLGVERLDPGRYVVRYNGRFSIEPLSPSQLQIESVERGFGAAERPIALVPDLLSIALHNDGLADSPALTVTLRLSGPGGVQEALPPQQVVVRAGEPALLRFPWTPTAPGSWTYEVIAGEGDTAARSSGEIVVAPGTSAGPAELIGAFGSVSPVLILSLLGACLLTAVAFSLALWPRTTK